MTLYLLRNKDLCNRKTHLFSHSLIQFRSDRKWKNTFFVSSPIFYVNAKPHIGHLYTALIADAIARFEKLKRPYLDVKFMTGTDEHGLKISTSAKEKKMDELSYCNVVSKDYQQLFNSYNVCYTDFLRTTERRHEDTVKKLWNEMLKNGYIYLGEYCGWYCVSDEAFISEQSLEPNKNPDGSRYIKESTKPTYFVKETNYKFKLSHFRNDLLYWLKKDIVKPEKFSKILESWIKNDDIMEDISVSRPSVRVQWGIPVPNDSSQNIYVWLDALSSYLTSSGYLSSSFHWPPDVQVIGKDILKFHGIFWPAFLMAAGLEPPRRILCHSHWIHEGEKMSKSKGNVVDPMKIHCTTEGFRYFLLRTGVMHSDGDYNESEAITTINAELADKLGNLVNRCLSKKVNSSQTFPNYCPEYHNHYCKGSAASLINALEILPGKFFPLKSGFATRYSFYTFTSNMDIGDSVCIHFENYNFYKGVDEIMSVISLTNKFLDEEKPWKLCGDPLEKNHLHIVLHFIFESLRICGILLQPIIPSVCNKLLNTLSVKEDQRTFNSIRPFSWCNTVQTPDTLLTTGNVLFPKISVSSNVENINNMKLQTRS